MKIVWLCKTPSPQDLARINPNLYCPVCGAQKGRIRCVMRKTRDAMLRDQGGQAIPPQAQDFLIMCQHTCAICGARWLEKPIAKNVGPESVLPSIARDESEKAEDSLSVRNRVAG